MTRPNQSIDATRWSTGVRPGIVGVVKDDIGSTPEGSDGEYSLDEDDQLQPEDTLDDRGVDDVLDEGYSPPDYVPKGAVHGLTSREQAEGETLDERLAEEEPDVDPYAEDDADDDHEDENALDEEIGLDEADGRVGRLVQPDAGLGEDVDGQEWARDIGIDGAGASAEEAAIHLVDDDR